jgi:hypothetical protein
MTLHFLHIGKTGGSAIKDALRSNRFAYWKEETAHEVPETPFGRIQLHRHSFRLEHLPPEDFVFFFLRDPVKRFVSGFESRRTRGQPRYYFEWKPSEKVAFEHFHSPQQLAIALTSSDDEERGKAEHAMRSIRHLGHMQRQLARPRELRKRLDQVVYIGRQETLAEDWRALKALLELPEDLELPTDPVRAHRREGGAPGAELDERAVRALREWYARDYRLLEFCDGVRSARGWGVPAEEPQHVAGGPGGRLRRALGSLRRA